MRHHPFPWPALAVACATWLGVSSALAGAEVVEEKLTVPIAEGPFAPTWDSLGNGYVCPEWYRDAKFGIWAHWGPQAVGESGDWFAKFMYCQDGGFGDSPWQRGAYRKHLETFGHPTRFGFKDILPLWKAEKWDPARLMALYKKAGAKFFVSMGVHHDNFDLWDSTYQPWNSVRIGPHKDIVGLWKQAADKEGLRFGVSIHADYSWWWYQPAFMSDESGPLAGVKYDAGRHPDGKGTWWAGLDLKDLYGLDLAADYLPGVDPRRDFWHATRDEFTDRAYARWYCTKWFNRVKDVVDKYRPDWLYFDGNTYPFSGHGTGRGLKADATQRILAHFYNANLKQHGGKLEAAMFLKGDGWDRRAAIDDHESAYADGILPEPWQSDNTIGDWFHHPGLTYDTGAVVHELLEVVSRNGTFLLNVPLRADGSLDDGAERVLAELGDWMAVNGEAIYGTRPWTLYGEGVTTLPGGKLDQRQAIAFTPADLRFTRKGETIYAVAMTWPGEQAVITSLYAGSPLVTGEIGEVRLLGQPGKLAWIRDQRGLVVTLPPKPVGAHAFALRIDGLKTVALSAAQAKALLATRPLVPDAAGAFDLEAGFAELHGAALRIEARAGRAAIGGWSDARDWLSWNRVQFPAAGAYTVHALVAGPVTETRFAVRAGAQELAAVVPAAAAAEQDLALGTLEIAAPGAQAVELQPRLGGWQALGLRGLRLVPLPPVDGDTQRGATRRGAR